MNRRERGARASRAAARRAQAATPVPQAADAFAVLIAVDRPGPRARAERAADQPGWEVRSLLNREDPIGLINRKAPDVLVISVDYARKANVGNLRAAQRYRSAPMRVVVVTETEEDAAQAEPSADVVLAAPWTWLELQRVLRAYAGGRASAAGLESGPPTE